MDATMLRSEDMRRWVVRWNVMCAVRAVLGGMDDEVDDDDEGGGGGICRVAGSEVDVSRMRMWWAVASSV